ncbi:unnamed protein product [Cylindrotheca closterium]|uniref:Uncharacterized protein n=1 Tax=Cylindrotheca closterium TaxID=2856 RepID=A0AAD2FCW0_9STRA|nr:unnamed protein product [Cylindrotheca closterium]
MFEQIKFRDTHTKSIFTVGKSAPFRNQLLLQVDYSCLLRMNNCHLRFNNIRKLTVVPMADCRREGMDGWLVGLKRCKQWEVQCE